MRPENTLLHAGFEPSEDVGQQVGGRIRHLTRARYTAHFPAPG